MYTTFKVVDNSGGKGLLCIRILRGTTYAYRVGDVIVGAVKGADPKRSIKDGQVIKAVIVCTKKRTQRKNGIVVHSSVNGVVLINDSGPIGQRIQTPVAQEIKRCRYESAIKSRAVEVY